MWEKLTADYLDCCRSQRAAKGTIKSKEIAIRHFRAGLTDKEPADIVIQDIEGFAAALCSRKATTAQLYLIHLKHFFKWATKRGHIKSNPMDDYQIKRVRAAVKMGYDFEEILPRLLKACRDKREELIVCLFAATGARIGELNGVTKLDVTDDISIISVTGKTGHRDILVNESLKELLAKSINGHKYLIMNKKHKDAGLSTQSIRGIVNGIAARAGYQNFRPHDFRRAYTIYLLDQGVDARVVAQLLGHSDVKTTLNYYAIPTPKRLKSATDLIKLPVGV